MISEKKQSRAGTGAARFIVRGQGYLDLSRAALLRPAYNEYPERFPLEPSFPQPGRRGASRAPVASGEGGAVPAPVGSIFPIPRARGSAATDFLNGAAASGVGSVCCVDQGDTLRNSPQVPAAGGIRSFATRRVPRPFVITHLQYWGSNTVPSSVTDLGLTVFIADDGSVSLTALVSSGRPLDVWEGGPVFEPFSVVTTHYPNIIVSEAGKFIKMQWVNNNAAALETMLAMSWKYID